MATFWLRINAALLSMMLIVGIAIVALLATRAYGGPLDPTGPPSSTLPQVEPRIPIDHVPFTISAAGSYFLTRDVTGPANTGDGITIASDDVTLDLNGFSVIGTAADTSQVHGFGITVSSVPRHNIVIRNGVVRDWNYGIVGDRAHQSRIDGVRAYNNKWEGIRGGTDTTITDCSSASNGEFGIESFGGTVQHCEVDGNTSAGIFVTDNSIVKDNSVHNNLFDGIDVANNADVEGNSIIASGGQGIVASGSANVIKDNMVQGSAKNGIDVLNNSTVEGNTVVQNNYSNTVGASGILSAGNNNGITANHVTHNFMQDILLAGSSSLVRGNSTQLSIVDLSGFNLVGPEVGMLSISTNPYPDANSRE